MRTQTMWSRRAVTAQARRTCLNVNAVTLRRRTGDSLKRHAGLGSSCALRCAELRKRADPKKAANSLQDEDMMIPSV